jgi:hypothetical protein
MRKIDRIIQLLEDISAKLDNQPAKTRKTTAKKDNKEGEAVNQLIKVYCDAYKARYGIHPPISGQTAGLARTLLRTISIDRASQLVQAYLQMDDAWFKTRCHDFATFTQNISKVAVALHHGTSDPHEKEYWKRVFGGNDEQRALYGTDKPPNEHMEKKRLPRGEGSDVLEGVSK